MKEMKNFKYTEMGKLYKFYDSTIIDEQNKLMEDIKHVFSVYVITFLLEIMMIG